MKLRNTRLLIAIAFALSASMVFTTNSFAVSRPLGGAGCSGDGCSGFNTGGYGNHLANSSGSGNLAGYGLVRFDAFRPETDVGNNLQECHPDLKDRKLYSSIGVPSNYDTYGVSYVHRRVAVLRSDPNRAMNGVKGTENWGTGMKFNLNTGELLPTAALEQEPTKVNPWVGPNWEGNDYCLPLNGGVDVDDALRLIEPVLKINNRKNTYDTPSRVVLRSRKATIDLELETAHDTNAVPQIDIAFDFNDIKVIGVDAKIVKKWEHEHPGWVEADKPPFLGWFDAKDKKSPFYVDSNPTSGSFEENGTNTFRIKYRKKGSYGLFVLACYDGIVFVGGVPVPLGSSGVSSASNPVFFNVISIKSINRK